MSDPVAKKYKRQLRYMEYVERYFKANEDKELNVLEYTDFDQKARQYNHIIEPRYDGIEY